VNGYGPIPESIMRTPVFGILPENVSRDLTMEIIR
jgi:hypothetical protein